MPGRNLKTLVILAAGNGSRFGGDKQFAKFGTLNKTLMEYNICHAIEAGFEHIIFITQPKQKLILEQQVIAHLPEAMTIDIVLQTLSDLPNGCHLASERTKPLGTAHAVWCARKYISNHFAVINADDYYGKQAFFLMRNHPNKEQDILLVTYLVKNTLSENGGVNRGLCQYNEQLLLREVVEAENIHKDEHGVIKGEMVPQLNRAKRTVVIDEDTLVSMNCWVFTPQIFPTIEKLISSTLLSENNHKCECYLPSAVMKHIEDYEANARVLASHDDWFGVTYAADTSSVNSKIAGLINKGLFSSFAN